MRIIDIPWYNRPGIRLKKKGVNSLSDAELLAIVLGRGNTKENAIDISNRVLKAYNFNGLASLSFYELKSEFKNQVPALKIIAMFEIFRRSQRIFKKDF
jgi:DNA repair protein RadC